MSMDDVQSIAREIGAELDKCIQVNELRKMYNEARKNDYYSADDVRRFRQECVSINLKGFSSYISQLETELNYATDPSDRSFISNLLAETQKYQEIYKHALGIQRAYNSIENSSSSYSYSSSYSGSGSSYSGEPAVEMTFLDALTTPLKKFATFTGRARRKEYWTFALVTGLISLLVYIINHNANLILGVILLLPQLSVNIRRLHDIGKSGWNLLWCLLPIIGGIMLLVWCCKDSESGSNQYGPNPKIA